MTISAPRLSFSPANQAAKLLATIANDASSSYRDQAAAVLAEWEKSFATPAQIAMVETSDELEVDDAGAGVSEGEGGFWVQAWAWVGQADEGEDEGGNRDEDWAKTCASFETSR